MKHIELSDDMARYVVACLYVADEDRTHIDDYNVTLAQVDALIGLLTTM